jgi:hypothetical protein
MQTQLELLRSENRNEPAVQILPVLPLYEGSASSATEVFASSRKLKPGDGCSGQFIHPLYMISRTYLQVIFHCDQVAVYLHRRMCINNISNCPQQVTSSGN